MVQNLTVYFCLICFSVGCLWRFIEFACPKIFKEVEEHFVLVNLISAEDFASRSMERHVNFSGWIADYLFSSIPNFYPLGNFPDGTEV